MRFAEQPSRHEEASGRAALGDVKLRLEEMPRAVMSSSLRALPCYESRFDSDLLF